MTPWYVKVFWWTLGIWALGHFIFSGDSDPEPYDQNPVPYTVQEPFWDNICPTGPC